MRYFKTAEGKILCTFQRCAWMRHEIIYRCKPKPEFPKYDPGFVSYPSPEYPEERRHGKMVEISEPEAMKLDPGLFESWSSYEELKRLESDQALAPAKKRRTVRESTTIQATLF